MKNEMPMTLAEEIRDYPRWFSSINDLMESRVSALSSEQAALYADESAEIARLEGMIPHAQEAVEKAKKDIEANVCALMEAEAKERFRDLYERYEITSSLARVGFAPTDMEGLKVRLKESLQNLDEIREIALPELREQRDKDEEDTRRKIAQIRAEYEPVLQQRRSELLSRYKAIKSEVTLSYDSLRDPEKHRKLPSSLTVGNCVFSSEGPLSHFSSEPRFEIPFEIPLAPNFAVAFLSPRKDKESERVLEGISIATTLHLLESFPKGKLKIALCSSELSSLSRLTALHHSLTNFGLSLVEKPYDTAQEYSALFRELEKKGNEIAARMSQEGCDSFAELVQAKKNKETYRLIVLHRCLKDFNPISIKRLKACLSDFARCGFLFLFVEDKLPEDIEPMVRVLPFHGGVAHAGDLDVYVMGLDYSMDELEIFDFVSRYAEEGKKS